MGCKFKTKKETTKAFENYFTFILIEYFTKAMGFQLL
jgi:hypothetical protein